MTLRELIERIGRESSNPNTMDMEVEFVQSRRAASEERLLGIVDVRANRTSFEIVVEKASSWGAAR